MSFPGLAQDILKTTLVILLITMVSSCKFTGSMVSRGGTNAKEKILLPEANTAGNGDFVGGIIPPVIQVLDSNPILIEQVACSVRVGSDNFEYFFIHVNTDFDTDNLSSFFTRTDSNGGNPGGGKETLFQSLLLEEVSRFAIGQQISYEGNGRFLSVDGSDYSFLDDGTSFISGIYEGPPSIYDSGLTVDGSAANVRYELFCFADPVYLD